MTCFSSKTKQFCFPWVGKRKILEVMGSIVKNWRELSGENKWEGLLNPLDSNLRRFIVHCGERTQAIEDAIIKTEWMSGYGFSRCPPEDFFSYVGLEKGNPFKYKVTKFIYAYDELAFLAKKESNWIGYVAVTDYQEGTPNALGRKDILIAWRGTLEKIEWEMDFIADLVSADDILGENCNAMVHKGWHSIYTATNENFILNKKSAREQVQDEVRRLVEDNYYKENGQVSITVTGHSMGAALATLNAVDLVVNQYNKPLNGSDNGGCMVTAIVSGSPRIGNNGFAEFFSRLKDIHILRITNADDPVPDLPKWLPIWFTYTHVGEELKIDGNISKYLKVKTPHMLEVYIQGVANTPDVNGETLERDYKLLNKSEDVIKEEYHVQSKWWVEKKKDMIQLDDGSWELDLKYYAPI